MPKAGSKPKKQAEVIIYSKDDCPYCVRAETTARSMGFSVEVLKLDEDFTRDTILEEFPGARTFPQIIFKGEKIGGYDAFIGQINKAQRT